MAEAELKALHELSTGGLMPHVTFLLDLPVEIGLERASGRGAADRMEQESVAFHRRVRDGFLKLAESEPDRIKCIDADRSVEDIAADIQAEVLVRLDSLPLKPA